MPDLTTAQLQRLTAARFEGPQALFTTAVAMLTERPALPDDLAGLVARLRDNGYSVTQRERSKAADAIKALSADRDKWFEACGAHHVASMKDAQRADIAEAKLAVSEPNCAVVKPLVWRESYGVFRAETQFGDYVVMGKILRLPTAMRPEMVCADTEAAKAAAQADYEPRILSAITLRTEAEVRAEAWAAAYADAGVVAADRCAACGVREIAGLVKEHVVRRTPDDARAALDRIKAEAEAEGMRKAADIARVYSEMDYCAMNYPEEAGMAASGTAHEIERDILAAIPEVRK